MFQTPLTGHFDMSCASWTGYSNFTNNGTNFLGKFKINGPDTDWEGTIDLFQMATDSRCDQLHIVSCKSDKTLHK